MRPLTIESSGRGLIRKGGSIIYLTVLYGIISHGGRCLKLYGNSDTDHSNHQVTTVIQSRRSRSDRGERQELYSI